MNGWLFISPVNGIRLALCVVFGVLVFRSAWVADDAYITFRTIDNWAQGYGPVWNIAERVQAYTHPLWMLMLSAAHVLTQDVYYTAIGLSLFASLATAGLLLRRVDGVRLWLVGLLLCTSKAFVDFSTSGLEDPLSHLLIVLSAYSLLKSSPNLADFRRSTLWVALAATCRLDLLVLLGPALLFQWYALPKQRARWVALAVGLLPLILWELFATLYYGHPLPNSAMAKLGARPWTELAPKGVLYLWNSLRWDPVLLLTCLLAFLPGLSALKVDWRPSGGLALGGWLYLLYVVSVGGDFMSGRFLTEPFVLALVLLTHVDAIPLQPLRLLLAGAFCQSLLHPFSPLRSGTDYANPDWDDAAIADERGYYYPTTGLLKLWSDGRQPVLPGRETPSQERQVVVMETIGVDGFTAGPEVHIIDLMGLGDPLLSRLTCSDDKARVGHYRRILPEGYEASLRAGQNVIVDPETAERYHQIQQLTRGELLDGERLRLIFQSL